MLTPKEKAQELITKFGYESSPDWADYNARLAIICVDEIIKSNPTFPAKDFFVKNAVPFWKQVKKELQKM
mgnify:CR=1 FL=1